MLSVSLIFELVVSWCNNSYNTQPLSGCKDCMVFTNERRHRCYCTPLRTARLQVPVSAQYTCVCASLYYNDALRSMTWVATIKVSHSQWHSENDWRHIMYDVNIIAWTWSEMSDIDVSLAINFTVPKVTSTWPNTITSSIPFMNGHGHVSAFQIYTSPTGGIRRMGLKFQSNSVKFLQVFKILIQRFFFLEIGNK